VGQYRSVLLGLCEPLTSLAIGVIDGGTRRGICEERARYFGSSHTPLLVPCTPTLPQALILMSDDATMVEKFRV
jgi:hypothetical protein